MEEKSPKLTHQIMKNLGFDTMDYEIDVIEWARPDTEYEFSITQSGQPVEDQPFTFDYDQGLGMQSIEIKSLDHLKDLYKAITGMEL